jgi:RNA polymerase sigma-70 factor, ECF subfamily
MYAPTHAKLDPVSEQVTGGHSHAQLGQDERVGAKLDEEALVRETLAGKRWAQREVWYRFAPMVYGLLRRTLGSRNDHDDLMQEVFLRVFRRLHSLEKLSALRSFVYSVAIRVISEEMRRFSVLRRTELQLMDLPHDRASAGADFESRDMLARIQRILNGMKVKHRAVFVLRHVEGMDLDEIAAGMDISLATVKRYLAKAMRCIEHSVARDPGLRASLASLMPREKWENA